MRRPAKIIPFPRRARPAAAPAPPAGTLVEVTRCRAQAEALIVRGLLESGGIPAVLRGHVVQAVHPFSVGDQGEVAVLVPAGEAAHARALLAARPRPGG